jgi:3-isopropylmalate/(R)-2-methylmalate dehydratase small subunit
MLAYYPFRLALNLLKIFKAIVTNPETELEVNLPEQTITLKATGEKNFDISIKKSKYD